MNFFDKIAIPPSANHVLLLKYILTISLILFIPYLGMMMGASFFSVYFKRKSQKTGNKLYSTFAKDIIEKLTLSKYAVVALGIIPLLSILFCYAQFLAYSGTNSLTYILFSVDIFILAFILIYVFRNSFIQKNIIGSLENIVKSNPEIESKSEMKDVHQLSDRLEITAHHSGFWGAVLLFVAAYLFMASISLASDPNRWADTRNILEIVFSWNSVFSFLYLFSAAGAITGSAILFYFFKWQGGLQNMSAEYSIFVKNFAITLAFVSSLALPLLLFMSFVLLPQAALSKPVFIYFILLLISVLVLCNLLYQMFKNSDISFAAASFFLIFIIFGFNILKDQFVLANALKEQTIELIAKSEEHENELKSKLITSSGVDAEQIYNTRCIACHKFDVKLVGPPYLETVPKYNGDANTLSEFIYNPPVTPKNAGFTPMPNQGLKKKEAIALAQWLISKVGGKK